MEIVKHRVRRVAIAVIGTVVVIIGIIAIPYPGPGWLIVFAGLAILATEFVWAQKVLAYAKSRYNAWTTWLKRQPWPVRLAVLTATGLVVVATLWFLNVFGMIAGWLHLPLPGLHSPLL